MAVSRKHLTLLDPYLEGDGPNDKGEWNLHCPLHGDKRRSASLNVENGKWYCHVCQFGGSVKGLIGLKDEWLEESRNGATRAHKRSKTSKAPEEITEARVQGWQAALHSNEVAMTVLEQKRGLSEDTIEQFELGWDIAQKCYTIPVRDEEGEISNVRRYQPEPKNDRRKIWSVAGMGTPTLFPLSVLDDDPQRIIICEGELDALLTIQHGFPAITRTGAAKVWKTDWNQVFAGKDVFLAHDADVTGQDGNRIVGRALRRIAGSIKLIHLPFPITEKHGEDLTDFWLNYSVADFEELLANATPFQEQPKPEDIDPDEVAVLDSFDANRVGRPLRMFVTIKGKWSPGYSVPTKVRFECTRDAGAKCSHCPLNAAGGSAEHGVALGDPLILAMIESTKSQMEAQLREDFGIPKCNKLDIELLQHSSVEVLYARPSIDHAKRSGSGDYTNIRITSVGRHDTLPNNTVQVTGALQPEPRKQRNEFLAWEVNKVETSLDRFALGRRQIKPLRAFNPSRRMRPLKRLGSIARDLSANVTHIAGRPEMHAAMDLVFHSALAFEFAGQLQQRGWLELLVVGDTRTGKSEAAAHLCRHYLAGEVVSCEAASYAGVIGGLQQYGATREWSVNWGVVPLNDRRLVVLDEVSGLSYEEIARMSSVRSSGVAELVKVQTERTVARTRLIWLGNPRNTQMGHYTYGVQAIKPLIGNDEDIARFDLAMAVHRDDVPSAAINRRQAEGKPRWSSRRASYLVRWVWSRTADQVKWAKGAEDMVLELANDMGRRYVQVPPLVQASNIRIKIARLSVALAARLFSTDDSGECILVRKEYVEDAVAFMDMLYSMPRFGYAELSQEVLCDEQEARDKAKRMRNYLRTRPELAKFLRANSRFRRQDIEEIMNTDRPDANAIINRLWESRMVKKEAGDIVVEPVLHDLLRQYK